MIVFIQNVLEDTGAVGFYIRILQVKWEAFCRRNWRREHFRMFFAGATGGVSIFIVFLRKTIFEFIVR